MKVNKVSVWRGFKMGATITHASGMQEVYEVSIGGSLEGWKDDGDTVEAVQNQLVGMMQIHLESQAVGARQKLRELAGAQAQITTEVLEADPGPGSPLPPLVPGREDRPPTPPAAATTGSSWCKGIPIGDGSFSGCAGLPDCPICHGSKEPDIKIWFARDEGKMVSELPLNSLSYAITKGKIYKAGKAEKAVENDPDAYLYAVAVDYWYKQKGGK